MIVRPLLLGCVLGAISLSQATAAPFCVQLTGIPLQCLYDDPNACRQEANRNGGRCAVNPAEFVMPPTSAQYCLVQAGKVSSCLYADFNTCDHEASRQGGACVAATPIPPPGPPIKPGVDPYAVTRP